MCQRKGIVDMTDKKSEIQAEEARLMEFFREMPGEEIEICKGLIENAAFMYVNLQELQKEVLEYGARIETQGGNGFSITKDNPAVKAYTTMISRYNTVIVQLIKFLRKYTDNKGSDLVEWLNSHE